MPYIRSKSESHYSLSKQTMYLCFWHRFGVVVITTAQLHSTQSELRFCADSNLSRGLSEICNGENL